MSFLPSPSSKNLNSVSQNKSLLNNGSELMDINFQVTTKSGWLDYDWVGSFHEGFARVQKNRKLNWIDMNGKELSKEWYDDNWNFSEWLAYIQLNERTNRINKKCNIISNNWYEDYNYVPNFKDWIVIVKKNSQYNWMDINWILLSNKRYASCRNFNYWYAPIKTNWKWNLISKNWKLFCKERYNEVCWLSEWYACIQLNNKTNWINSEWSFLWNIWYDWWSNFSEWLAQIILNGWRNFIDKKWLILCDMRFSNASNFQNWFSQVSLDTKENRINTDWKILCDNRFLNVSHFHEWFAKFQNLVFWVSENNWKHNWIDTWWKILSKQWYNDCWRFYNWFAFVNLNWKFNFINNRSEILSDTRYDKVESFSEWYAPVYLSWKWRNFIDSYWKYLFSESKFSEIEKTQINKKINNNIKNWINEVNNIYAFDQNREDIKSQVFKQKWNFCSICWSTNSLDIHHILPRKMWWKDEITNLQVVCRTCHEHIHGYEIDSNNVSKKRKISRKIEMIQKAMKEWKSLFITYIRKETYRTEKIITHRKIDPLELYYQEKRQYLKSHCHLRNAERHFRISNMQHIQIVD